MTTRPRFVVVGAGSAGCALAARLSEDAGHDVVLLEAGGGDWHPMLRIPLAAGKALRAGAYGWGYEAAPSPGLHGRKQAWPRGKVLGGTSAINGMVYIRGHRADYDAWAAAGNPGWSYAEVLPYFRRTERHLHRTDEYHGQDGPIEVTRSSSANPLYTAFVTAGIEAGFPATDDFNGVQQEGFGRYDFTIARGRRSSAARYLQAASGRANLSTRTRCHVTRILLDGQRATGVEYLRDGAIHTIEADEVLLCAGAVGSPHLLMLSGIGAPAALESAGIPVRHRLPGVGENLQDHVSAALRIACRQPLTLHSLIRADRIALAMAQAWLLRSGPATEFPCEAGAFTRLSAGSIAPDVQWHFFIAMNHERVRWPWPRAQSTDPLQGEGFTIGIYVTRPDSRGRITLRSGDPRIAPVIEPDSLGCDSDVERLVDAALQAREVASQPALAAYTAAELAPGPTVRTRGEIAEWARRNAGTVYHPVGTCRMGNDEDAVVDAALQVRGIAGLRVCDASIMPTLVRGNTNAPAMMIGEKAADLVMNRQALQRPAGSETHSPA